MAEFTIKVQVPEGWEPDEPSPHRIVKLGEHYLSSMGGVFQAEAEENCFRIVLRRKQRCGSCEMQTYHEFDQNYVICRPTLPRWVILREHVMGKADGAACPTYQRRSKT